jgi:hypothetical protein
VQEYLKRRANAPETADGHWKLALWCEQNCLKQQAIAHFHQVLRLDPSREAARTHLGFKKVGGRWVKPELMAAARAAAQQQQKANRHWRPLLERWRNGLQSKEKARRGDAEQALSQVTDRWAVRMVWTTFGRAEPALQKVAVQVLGQIDDRSASRLLALLAVFSGSPEVRGLAIASLRKRDAREFADVLIALIRQPIEFEVKKVGGPGQGGQLLIKGQGSAPNLKRLYEPPSGPQMALAPGDQVFYDEYGLPVVMRPSGIWETGYFSVDSVFWGMQQPSAQQKNQITAILAQSGLGAQSQKIAQGVAGAFVNQANSSLFYTLQNPLAALAFLTWNPLIPFNPRTRFSVTMATGDIIPVGRMEVEAQKSAAVAERQLETDVEAIKQYNASLRQINDRVVPVLQDIAGQNTGPDPSAWQEWFIDLVGYQVNQLQRSENPTVIENVPLAYQPPPIPISSFAVPIAIRRMSCFGAGTMIRTLSGMQAIETLKVGDAVLTQSTESGALAFRPILVLHHNPPSKTFRIKFGEETIVSSQYHRFWKAGSGWVMARELKMGDSIRTLGGTTKVTAIDEGEVVPVFNLEVAEDADFFVGQAGALAHDNTLPNLREQPFDAVGALTDTAATVRAGIP